MTKIIDDLVQVFEIFKIFIFFKIEFGHIYSTHTNKNKFFEESIENCMSI